MGRGNALKKMELATPIRSSGPTGQADTDRRAQTGNALRKGTKIKKIISRPSTIFRTYGVNKDAKALR